MYLLIFFKIIILLIYLLINQLIIAIKNIKIDEQLSLFFLKSLFSVNITTSSERQCSFLLSQVDCSWMGRLLRYNGR